MDKFVIFLVYRECKVLPEHTKILLFPIEHDKIQCGKADGF